MESGTSAAEALVVQGRKIAYVGSRQGAESLAAALPGCARIDLQGKRVIPGLFDMHAHLDREGLKLLYPPLTGVKSRHDVLERVADIARSAKPGEWIVTMPIGEPPFYFFSAEDEQRLYPTRDELDEVVPSNPVYIRPILGFWRWSPLRETLISAANSAALHAVGLRDEASAPSPSVFLERDGSGRLTGRFFESTTASIVELSYFARRTAVGHEERVRALRQSQKIASGFGITTVFEGHGAETAVLNAYKSLRNNGELKVRSELAFSPSWSLLEKIDLPRFVDRWAGWLSDPGLGDDYLRVRGLFINALSSDDDRVRAQCGSYTGFAGYNFDSAIGDARLVDLLVALARANIRAVGLSRRLFQLYRATHSATPLSGKRWMVQHCGPLSEDEIDLTRDLGLGLTFLPVEHIFKQGYIPRDDARVAHDWMPMRRLADRGIPFSIATDNIPPSLFFAAWLCLARTDRYGHVVPDPDGPMRREDIFKAATIWSAEILGCDGQRGSLHAGKEADLAVLDTDVLTCPVDDIRDATALATMLGGEWVHVAPNAPVALQASTPNERHLN